MLKKSLPESALLEMSGYPTNQELAHLWQDGRLVRCAFHHALDGNAIISVKWFGTPPTQI